MADSKLYLTVRNRVQVLFEGNVLAMSSVNDSGPFDVLPQHANFISLVQQYIRILDENNRNHEIAVDNGVLRVRENRAVAYLGVRNEEALALPSRG